MLNPRPTRLRPSRLIATLLLCQGAAACMVGPNYHRPTLDSPPAFKEAAGWAPAQPSDAADKKDWWTVFGDPVLSNLEARVNVSNQTLAADEAAYREAHYIVAENRAALFPTVSANASIAASHSGGGTVVGSGTGGTGTGGTGTGGTGTGGTGTGGTGVTTGSRTVTTFQPSLGASWAPDLWGSVRRNIASARATAQASAATLANARLSIQTELATDYIQLRQFDQEKSLYDQQVAAYARSLQVSENKYRVGNAARSDVLTAQTSLQSAQATDADLGRQRALMEHAIAVLVGVPPADLDIAPAPWVLKLPDLPAVVPSVLLQRRPDIAQAERTAASANELIGVQVAAYFPTLGLTGNVGLDATSLGKLFNPSSFFWTLGSQAAQSVFDAGLRHARVQAARAAYDVQVANYREAVLTAFQQVENNLAAQRIYGAELALIEGAAQAAVLNQTLTLNEYNAGLVDYTTVSAAQAQALGVQIQALQIQSARLATAVALIEALGGGWTTADLPRG